VQDEGELVECQGHAGAKEEGQDLQRQPRRGEGERDQPGDNHVHELVAKGRRSRETATAPETLR